MNVRVHVQYVLGGLVEFYESLYFSFALYFRIGCIQGFLVLYRMVVPYGVQYSRNWLNSMITCTILLCSFVYFRNSFILNTVIRLSGMVRCTEILCTCSSLLY